MPKHSIRFYWEFFLIMTLNEWCRNYCILWPSVCQLLLFSVSASLCQSLAVSVASHLSGHIEEGKLPCVVQSERHNGMIFLDSTTTTGISYIGLNIVGNCINRCTNMDGGVCLSVWRPFNMPLSTRPCHPHEIKLLLLRQTLQTSWILYLVLLCSTSSQLTLILI